MADRRVKELKEKQATLEELARELGAAELGTSAPPIDRVGGEAMTSPPMRLRFKRIGSDFDEPVVETSLHSNAIKEEAFYAASIVAETEEEAAQLSSQIAQDLQSTGTSTDLLDIYDQVATAESEIEREALQNFLQDPSISAKEKVDVVVSRQNKPAELPDMREKAAELSFASDQPANRFEEAAKIDIFEMMDANLEWAVEKESLMMNQAADFDDSLLASIGGIVELIIPFVDQAYMSKMQDELEVETNPLVKLFLLGESRESLRDAFLNVDSLEERQEIERKALEVMSGFWGGDFKKMVYHSTLFGEYQSWERWVDNFISVLDVALLAKPLAWGGRILGRAANVGRLTNVEAAEAVLKGRKEAAPSAAPKVSPRHPIKAVEAGSKDEAADAVVALLEAEEGVVRAQLGISKPQLAGEFLIPRWGDEVLEDAPSDIIARVEERNVAANLAEEQAQTAGYVYTEQQKINAARRVLQDVRQVDGLKPHVNKSYFENDGESFFGEFLFGRTEKSGFGYVQDAVKAAREGGLEAGELRIWKKVPGSDVLEPVPLTGDELYDSTTSLSAFPRGSYFVGRKFRHDYSPMDAALFGHDTVTGVGKLKYGRWLGDVTALFKEHIAQAAGRAADVGLAIEQRVVKQLERDIRGLSTKQHRAVFSVLEKGSEEAKTYTYTDLRTRFGLSDKEINAYYSYRQLSDRMWSWSNRIFRNQLRTGNFSIVRGVTDEGEAVFARPVRPEEVRATVVYDPAKGEVVPLPDTVKGSIVEMERPMRVQKGSTTHVVDYMIIDNKKLKLDELPTNPLPYREGYYRRAYKELYFIEYLPSRLENLKVNGKTPSAIEAEKIHGVTVAAGSSLKRLESKAAELNAADTEGRKYFVRRAKEYGDSDVEMLRAASSYFAQLKRRGDALGSDIDRELADISDPLEALMGSMRTISQSMGQEPFIQAMKKQWVNTYGRASGHKFPQSFSEVSEAELGKERYRDARRIWDQIVNMRRLMTSTDRAWKNMMLDVAEMVEKTPGGNLTSKVPQGLSQQSIVNFARGIPSTLFISLNFLRQAVIQTSQLLQLGALDPKYLASGQIARDIYALGVSSMTWTRGEKAKQMGITLGAKIMGVPKNEFKRIAEAYLDKSGLANSMDSYSLIEGTVKNTQRSVIAAGPVQRGANMLSNAYHGTVNAARAVGFDAGEFANLTGHWMYSLRRWQRQNPKIAGQWDKKANLDEISKYARALSYSMGQPGAFEYQRGLASVFLQFMSVPHKAYLSMMPAGLGGSRTLTAAEKARLTAYNFVLFGGSALGVSGLINEFLSTQEGLSDETKTALVGGTMDLLMNGLINSMADEDADTTAIKFSESFSPTNQLPYANVLATLLEGDLIRLMGPVTSATGKLAEVVDDLSYLAIRKDLDTDEKMIRAIEEMAEVSSGGSNAIKAYFAAETGKIISSSGSAIVHATYAEAVAKLFGMSTYSEDIIWEHIDDLQSRGDTAAEVADIIYRRYVKDSVLYENEREEWRRRQEAMQFAISVVDESMREEVLSRLTSKFRKHNETVEDSIFRQMARYATGSAEGRSELKEQLRKEVGNEKADYILRELEWED